MIDSANITNFNASKAELEELILFWVCAAGKNGTTAARCLDRLLTKWRSPEYSVYFYPFTVIKTIDYYSNLEQELKEAGIGCYKSKTKTFLALINSGINLRTCTVEDLEDIYGIGPKTARCFLIHSRPDQRYAGLDTHILKYLRSKGHEVPKSTPTGNKYRKLEKIFLEYADQSGMSVAEFDLHIWNSYKIKSEPQLV